MRQWLNHAKHTRFVEPFGVGRVEHLGLAVAVVAQMVLSVQIVLDRLLVDVGTGSRYDFDCCLREDCVSAKLLSDENLRWSDHLGD